MENQKTSLAHRLEYWGYLFVESAILKIPDAAIPAVAKFFATIIYKILGVRKQVTLENLKIAFPEKDEAWREEIAFASYAHFAEMILVFMKLRKWSNHDVRQKIAEYLPWEAEEFIENGKPIILVSGHFGNWEMGMAFLYTLGGRTAVIQQRQKNRLVDERMKSLREKWGMKIVYPRGAVSACIRQIQEGHFVALLGDQDAGKRGVFVPFFNRLASTHIGVAAIHQKTGAPIFHANCIRLADGKFRLELIPVATGQKEKPSPEEITANFTALLEKEIRKYPEQYFWMHRRWKSAK